MSLFLFALRMRAADTSSNLPPSTVGRNRVALSAVIAGIPAPFTQEQGELILELAHLHESESAVARQLLDSLAVENFSEAQTKCIREMLALDAQDFKATLADAMVPCVLRDTLRFREAL